MIVSTTAWSPGASAEEEEEEEEEEEVAVVVVVVEAGSCDPAAARYPWAPSVSVGCGDELSKPVPAENIGAIPDSMSAR
jgi:hypothetical protein